jgi:hypothetical protein
VTRRLLTALALTTLLAPAAARASTTQESMFQDDNRLEFAEPKEVAATLDRLKALGVDRVRVSVFWVAVAPDPSSNAKPKGFDGSDPDAYPQDHWARYDTLARLAAERGIGVMWNVTAPAPDWATGSPKLRPDLDDVWTPSAGEFGAFVTAIARRYSGSYIRPDDRPKVVHHPAQGIEGLPNYKPPYDTTTAPGPPLPRVDWWEIWNEPNQGAWLAPQWKVHRLGGHGRWVPNSPRLYRRIADVMYSALAATGHGSDTILVGATAPKGLNVQGPSRAMKPATFIRDLYCVDRHNQVFRGKAASVRGCPTKDAVGRFPGLHPVLFHATGFAHHPYELTFSPSTPPPDPAFYTIGNLGRLSFTLRYAYLRYRQSVPSTGVPLYLTEFGYQTNPPDRIGVSLARQAAYLDQAEYIAWRTPAVRTLSQFLLVDGGPPVDKTFQTGLLFSDGRSKPAYQAYKLPIWLPKHRIRPRSRVRIWGLVRPAANGSAPEVAIQFRRPHGRSWHTVATRHASDARGYLYERVRLPGTGRVRLSWNGQVSRSVIVRAR